MTSSSHASSSVQAAPRHVLRHATASEHARVEEIVGSITCRQSYSRYLVGSLSFRTPIELAIAGDAINWPRCLDGWKPTLIAEELQADLHDLSLESDCARLPFDLKDLNAIGILYVLEGSSLGARLLERQARDLGFDASFGARHLARQMRSSWKDFVTRLDRCSPEEFEGAQFSARVMFDFVALMMKNTFIRANSIR